MLILIDTILFYNSTYRKLLIVSIIFYVISNYFKLINISLFITTLIYFVSRIMSSSDSCCMWEILHTCTWHEVPPRLLIKLIPETTLMFTHYYVYIVQFFRIFWFTQSWDYMFNINCIVKVTISLWNTFNYILKFISKY